MADHDASPFTLSTRCCSIVPPYLLEALTQSGDADTAQRARRTIERDRDLRLRRHRDVAPPTEPSAEPGPPPVPNGQGAPQRVVSDAQGAEVLPGQRVRAEGDQPVADVAVNEAYDGLGNTWTLYFDAFARDSLDGKGMPLLATVHYGQSYDNAFWDGSQMVFGDGDGLIFNRFTVSLDVIGHELAHGVTEHTAGLVYSGQSGALNESVSDVFGSLVKQRALDQTADQADWLVGAELLTDAVQGRALRDMANPGTAYDDPQLGKDPQPGSMAGYVETTSDNGGVHINSGIANRAFTLAARAIGGRVWEGAGLIWYDVLTGDISADCDFATFAALTVAAAGTRCGEGSSQQQAVSAAWTEVGVLAPSDAVTGAPEPQSEPGEPGSQDRQETAAPARGHLHLTRSGGFAGLQQERTVRLQELPQDDAVAWQTLLFGDTLRQLAELPMRPDAFTYQVRYLQVEMQSTPPGSADLDLSLPEPGLPVEVRDLFRRTLGSG